MDFFDRSNLSMARVEARISSGNGPKMLGWNVAADELKNIPEHWLGYEEPEASLHYLLGILYIAFTVFSLVGNGLVIWIFSCSKSLRTPSNVFIVNLAICDFVMMLKTPIFIYNSFHRGFALGVWGCRVFGLMGALSGIGAAITNACIAYDRYKTIAKPLGGRLSMKKAFLILLMIWGYVMPWSLAPYLEVWGRFVPEGFLTSCTFDYLTDSFDIRMFVGSIFTFSYCIPMSLILFFYSRIVSQVVAHEKALRDQAKKMNVESLRSNIDQQKACVEIRIAKAAITVCFLFVCSWTPYAVLALIGAFGDKTLLTPGVTMIPALTCKFVACLDPWIYAISHPRYRLELQHRMPWLAINEKAETASATTEVTTMANMATSTT